MALISDVQTRNLSVIFKRRSVMLAPFLYLDVYKVVLFGCGVEIGKGV